MNKIWFKPGTMFILTLHSFTIHSLDYYFVCGKKAEKKAETFKSVVYSNSLFTVMGLEACGGQCKVDKQSPRVTLHGLDELMLNVLRCHLTY